MTLTIKEQKCFEEIRYILAERLLYCEKWNNVGLTPKSRYVDITWFGSKFIDDPEGRVSFETRRVAPMTLATLKAEVKRQRNKLKKDKKNYES